MKILYNGTREATDEEINESNKIKEELETIDDELERLISKRHKIYEGCPHTVTVRKGSYVHVSICNACGHPVVK